MEPRGLDVDVWRAWQLGRAYHDMGVTNAEAVRRFRDLGPLGYAALNGFQYGSILRQLQELNG
jgi:hypothetical protein